MTKNDDSYKLTLDNDKTLKQLFERFYIIRKDNEYLTPNDRKIIEKYMTRLIDEDIKTGRNGYIVVRGRRKKLLTFEQQIEILESDLSIRELAKIYKVSSTTIFKVKKGCY